MADENFCDFQGPIDTSMMSSLPGFWERPAHESYGVGALECLAECAQLEKDVAAASNANNNPEFCRLSNKLIFCLINNKHNNHGGEGLAVAADSTVADVRKEYYNNSGLTGSPDDSKELQMAGVGGGHMGGMSAMHQNMLAKPVPMKRLSEKRIAQARACLGVSNGMDHSMVEPQSMMQSVGEMGSSPALARALSAIQQTQKRPRSEKKAIPVDQKDNKYFERRKRNNNAAKKSRDARKAREDEIAIRASFLEKENAILRAQVATLREEANSLRQLLLQKRARH